MPNVNKIAIAYTSKELSRSSFFFTINCFESIRFESYFRHDIEIGIEYCLSNRWHRCHTLLLRLLVIEFDFMKENPRRVFD